ncbi:folate/biopterin transporter [Chloropicon primus]|uniref:Folate/biopterin transporter n=2 Tax=Chloropicon primus TaxID=1764295 RepID=A0A5B8MG88_9CHLO|nr:folate/biopterin transporter [Chloropicon primus]UPQ98638.1 folate/biopterin transporter [Chloropicon primus]|eukprot:QDZ19429.1 folate/biopterin transporter [Chloropicon primus]
MGGWRGNRPLEWVRGSRNYWNRLVGNFTLEFIVLLTSCYYGVKGTLYTFVQSGQLPYFQKYVGITGIEYQKYKLVSSLPWAMKAWIGLISDNYPIWGYNKRYYMVLATFIGSVSFALLGVLDIDQSTALFAALLLFFASLDMATVDLLCEGKYAEKMMEKPETSSDLVSWVWGVYQLGSLTASLFIGPVSDRYSPKIIYLIAVPFALQFLIPLALGYLPEERVSPASEASPIGMTRTNWNAGVTMRLVSYLPRKMREKPRIFVMAFLTALSALLLGVVHLTGTEGQQLTYTICASVMLCACSSWALPPVLSRANIYMFLCQVLYIQVSGALDYFYTAGPECFAGGPSFSFSYYTTYTVIVGSLAAWLGVVLFQAWMRDWNFRRVFWLTTFVRVIGSIFDICIALRWNLSIGISDKTMYMFGDAVIYNIVYQMDFMPAVVLTSKVCPKGLESTIYALLAGMQNMGQNVSQSLGSYLIEAMGVKTACKPSVDEECDCDFDNLPLLLFVSHMVLPLLTIPLTFLLIPNRRMTDTLDVGNDDHHRVVKEDEVELMPNDAGE